MAYKITETMPLQSGGASITREVGLDATGKVQIKNTEGQWEPFSLELYKDLYTGNSDVKPDVDPNVIKQIIHFLKPKPIGAERNPYPAI